MFLYINFVGAGDGNINYPTQRYIKYITPSDMDTGDISWSQGGISKINELSQAGWKISARLPAAPGTDSRYVYELRRLVSDD